MSKAVSCKCFNNDVKFYYNNSLEGTIDLDLDIMSINSIRLLVSEAHFHIDNIKITTNDDSYVLEETFDEDFLVLPGESVEYSYNHNDERVSKSVNGSATYYLTDGNDQVLSEYDDNGMV